MRDMLLVTGALGFIGANLTRALNSLGYDELLLVDHLGTNEKWRNIRTLCFEEYLDRADFLSLIKEDRLSEK
ncbi:NAD-dependent epimerase/dehydratase family protein, partial [bacterium]|nr:NAD-dependent epimerase/dehydratase family protein [bacterium]